MLLSRDGFFVSIDPKDWKKGAEAVAAVDAAVPDELVVRMEPSLSERTDAVEDAASEKLSRRWVVSEELELLPDRLEESETIVTLCEAMKGISGRAARGDRPPRDLLRADQAARPGSSSPTTRSRR